ncbi:macrolide family glycosyltransferase [Chitinophaga arvensicola]|uniref:Glycosyltransferase, MGT family n=1 Tax=Chitinophaga arvensicola TaxID=29529 RepID=A0A1I0S6H4_9BACT|nr:macrolide family glycosyltransferase [Chitinophaga arvensicola]SEW51062.1 glycosyltransferase, MGT family [Chitinophaga arvensicola]
MSKVLFLGLPSHGHVNPTLGLVSELVKQGEEIFYFSSLEFKEKIEAAGATFAAYAEDLNIFKPDSGDGSDDPMVRVITSADKIIADILYQIKDHSFDYIIHSAAFPFTKVLAPLLKIPTVSSLAVFAGLRDFFEASDTAEDPFFPGMQEMIDAYQQTSQRINDTYGVQLPENFFQLILNTGDINLVYTSRYFAPDEAYFDDRYKFVGPPVFERKENMDFPFELLENKKVIYISLGTIFSNHNHELYNIFFRTFADQDVVVVMAAYEVDLSGFDIPANFIVRNYVPQSAVLPYTAAAITHAGMNSISDLVYNDIPFVALPLGADQPLLAKRAEELGAAISLNADTLTPETLRLAVEKVIDEPGYLENIKKISASFREAGGYKKAVEEIFTYLGKDKLQDNK